MQHQRREVVITGMGFVLPNCNDKATFWRQLSTGDSQLTLQPDPSIAGAKIPMGRLTEFDPHQALAQLGKETYERYSPEVQLYMASLLRAMDDARFEMKAEDPERVGLFTGSSRPTQPYWEAREQGPNAPPYGRRELMATTPGASVGHASSYLGLHGPCYLVSSACASGAVATGLAYEHVANGEVDVAIASGYEMPLFGRMLAIYRAAGILSTEAHDAKKAMRPFASHSGNVIGEGAVTLILEEREHARKRGAEEVAAIIGYAYGNDGSHPMRTDREGTRAIALIRRMLRMSERTSEDVDVVVGHGNGTPLSDASEEAYMRAVFGSRRAQVPLVSTKPIYGHTVAPSAIISLAATAFMLKNQFIIPTINVDVEKLAEGANHQANVGKAAEVDLGVVFTYGMGGHNAGLLLQRAGKARA